MGKTAKHIVANTAYGSLINVLSSIFSLAGYAIIIRHIPIAEYGIFIFLISFVPPIVGIIFFGFDRIFVSKIAQGIGTQQIGKIKGLIKEYYIIIFSIFSIVVIGMIVARYLFISSIDNRIIIYFWYLLLFVFGQLLMNTSSLLLEGYEKFKRISMLEFGDVLIRNLSLIFFLVLGMLNLKVLFIVYAFPKICMGLYGWFQAGRILLQLKYGTSSSVQTEKHVVRDILMSYGKWEIGRNILDQLLSPVKVWVIAFFVNIQAVAAFDVAKNIYSFAISFLPVKKVIFPLISKNVQNKIFTLAIIAKVQKYIFLYYTAVYGLVLLVVPFILRFFSPQYVPYIFLINVVLIHLYVEWFKIGHTALFYALDKYKFLFILYPFVLLLQIILDILLTRGYGVVGTAFAWHIHTLIVGLISFYYLSKKIGIPIFSIKNILIYDAYDKIVLLKVKEIGRKFLFWQKYL